MLNKLALWWDNYHAKKKASARKREFYAKWRKLIQANNIIR